jgi:DNA-binding MarR family transcriptional regulator
MMLPEKRVTDRRIQKTQNLLREALVSLIHEKNYDSIVVKEILDRANVGRSRMVKNLKCIEKAWFPVPQIPRATF